MLHGPAWELCWLVVVPDLGLPYHWTYSYPSWRTRTTCLCLFAQPWLYGVIMNKQRPLGTCLCLRLKSVIDAVACPWLPALIAHLFPNQTKITICTQCISSYRWISATSAWWRWVCTLAEGKPASLLKTGCRVVTILLEIQNWELKSNRMKAVCGEVQVLYLVAN